MLRKYRMGFDVFALLLFLLIMLPTWLWMAFPAPDDVLRAPSRTPALDGIGMVCQIVFVFLLCTFLHEGRRGLAMGPMLLGCLCCIGLYFAGWVMYYAGITAWPVILLMTLPPCLAFGFWALHQRCHIALIPIGGFMVCHLIGAVVNHMA